MVHKIHQQKNSPLFSGMVSELSAFGIDEILSEEERELFVLIYGKRSKRTRNGGGSLLVDPLKARLALDKVVCRSTGIDEPQFNLEYIEQLLSEIRRFGNGSNLDMNVLQASRDFFLAQQK